MKELIDVHKTLKQQLHANLAGQKRLLAEQRYLIDKQCDFRVAALISSSPTTMSAEGIIKCNSRLPDGT